MVCSTKIKNAIKVKQPTISSFRFQNFRLGFTESVDKFIHLTVYNRKEPLYFVISQLTVA